MDYEKKYKETLERARQIQNTPYTAHWDVMKELVEDLFPELKESEDERIRKAIGYAIGQSTHSDGTLINGVSSEEALAWLEKQGGNNMGISEATKQELEDSLHKALEKETPESCNEFLDEQILANSAKTCKDEQKPAWSEEDESMFDLTLFYLDRYVKMKDVSKCEIWIKSLKDRVQPKQEWKQENTCDLTDFENTMMHIGESFFGKNAGLDPNDTNAIKEQANILLGLVPSKEWSEEDENIKESIITGLEMLKDGASDQSLIALYNKRIDWLNSLKDRVQSQNTWKPSDEQMDALEDAIADAVSSIQKNMLNSLYQDLQKLR